MKKRGEVEERREDPCARLGSGRSEQPCVSGREAPPMRGTGIMR